MRSHSHGRSTDQMDGLIVGKGDLSTVTNRWLWRRGHELAVFWGESLLMEGDWSKIGLL